MRGRLAPPFMTRWWSEGPMERFKRCYFAGDAMHVCAKPWTAGPSGEVRMTARTAAPCSTACPHVQSTRPGNRRPCSICTRAEINGTCAAQIGSPVARRTVTATLIVPSMESARHMCSKPRQAKHTGADGNRYVPQREHTWTRNSPSSSPFQNGSVSGWMSGRGRGPESAKRSSVMSESRSASLPVGSPIA